MPAFIELANEIRALPNYTVSEASHYLDISESTLKSWMVGRSYPSRTGVRRFSALIPPAQRRPVTLLSFVNIVEAHVLHAIRHEYRVKLPKVRRALDYVANRLGVSHPLVNHQFQTDGIDLFIEHLGKMIVASEGGQVALRHAFEAHLARVQYDENRIARRLFLFTRPCHEPSQPRFIVMDPMISFGRPIISGSGVPTIAVYERYLAGDEPDHLAKDFRRDLAEIHEAIRCESRNK